MLKDILKIINEYGFISKTVLASKLNLPIEMIESGLDQLVNMGYIVEEKASSDCLIVCSKCPFATNCNKQIIKTYQVSSKALDYFN